jgi:type II secretory pathway component PulJ
VRPGIGNRKGFLRKAQVLLEAVLALAMLALFLLGAMAILKSANQ